MLMLLRLLEVGDLIAGSLFLVIITPQTVVVMGEVPE